MKTVSIHKALLSQFLCCSGLGLPKHGKESKWIQGTIVDIKGPETYLVRVPGNNRRFVHANHLTPDDAREQSAKRENIEREIVECNPTPLSREIPVTP